MMVLGLLRVRGYARKVASSHSILHRCYIRTTRLGVNGDVVYFDTEVSCSLEERGVSRRRNDPRMSTTST